MKKSSVCVKVSCVTVFFGQSSSSSSLCRMLLDLPFCVLFFLNEVDPPSSPREVMTRSLNLVFGSGGGPAAGALAVYPSTLGSYLRSHLTSGHLVCFLFLLLFFGLGSTLGSGLVSTLGSTLGSGLSLDMRSSCFALSMLFFLICSRTDTMSCGSIKVANKKRSVGNAPGLPMNSTMAASSHRITMGPLVAAIDQGTSSTRFLVFNAKTAELLSHHQVEIKQSFPKEGWVEEDPKEILQSVYECMERTCEKLTQLNIDISNIKAIGVTNQRETTLVWDKETGEPLYNAIVWLDLRTQSTVERLINKTPGRNKNHLKHKTGLPISTYFSAVKLRWLMDNVDEVHDAVVSHRAMFGTVDSWLIWCLTGGKSGGVHCTDVTNASRTMLFNIHTLDWDPELCTYFGIPMEILPKVRSSSEIYGLMKSGALSGIPISGPVMSEHGLLTTVAYKLGRDQPACYALEGSVAIAGAVVRWLQDNLGIIKSSEELEQFAASVGTSYGCYFVPAFSGLYAPYWEPSARGIICGLTQFTNKYHVAFAALEAVCFQTREILDAMNQDSGIPLTASRWTEG
ncbi:hypothetical protein F7725_009234 [Dissostichus mawsoni]|uniref:glycerol kinase n=1 Tax=Dissostichus mawsoni TaxID=36200 RepID=A0A7J5Z6M1_DISMA|nr:hypothetical protein F7725_009234 [Dissostichus mawsoni]